MTTISNPTGSKIVIVQLNGGNTKDVRASYCQVYKGDTQVLQAKSFASEANAAKWAAKVLA